jgi:hypothetical protein
MTKAIRQVILGVAIILSLSHVHRAEAFRWRRSNCNVCCQPSCCYGGYERDCLQTKIADMGGGQFLYYAAVYYSSACSNPDTGYWQDVDKTLPENCPACEDPNAFRSGSGPGCPDFGGFASTMNPDTDCCWSGCVQKCGCHYECLKLCGECKTIKVEVVTLWVPAACRFIHVAFEVNDFPKGCHPCEIPISACNCTKLHGGHAYRLHYGCKKVLLLTHC